MQHVSIVTPFTRQQPIQFGQSIVSRITELVKSIECRRPFTTNQVSEAVPGISSAAASVTLRTVERRGFVRCLNAGQTRNVMRVWERVPHDPSRSERVNGSARGRAAALQVNVTVTVHHTYEDGESSAVRYRRAAEACRQLLGNDPFKWDDADIYAAAELVAAEFERLRYLDQLVDDLTEVRRQMFTRIRRNSI